MGFGFNLFLFFILIPLTILLLVIWLITKKNIYGKLVGIIGVGIFCLSILVETISIFTDKKRVEQKDIYGEYVIDREKFPGRQADWQYNNFRFKITQQDSLLFYITNEEKVFKTYRQKIIFYSPNSGIISIKSVQPEHHILENQPILYREVWGFYYVFNSPKFGNMFFKKGEWKSISGK